MIYQGDVMNTLSYLLGERTVPNTGTEGRKDFIQRTLEEVYKTYPWRFNEGLASLTVTASGIASLPSDYAPDHPIFATYYTTSGTQTDMDEAPLEEQDVINIGDNKYWIDSTTGDGNFILNTKEVITQIIVRYQKSPPAMAASVGTPYRSTMVLALGALRYYRKSQDPEADISQDEALFQKRLQETISAVHLTAPRRLRKTRQSVSGYYTGAE